MRNFFRKLFQKVYHKLNYDVQKNLLASGKLLSVANKQKNDITSLEEVEFQIFSQRGEDGIIQYIVDKIDIPNKIFIEFGVENYTESNTRFLLINNHWSGLVIDGSKSNIEYIKNDFIYWKYDITAIESFITTQNINALIQSFTGSEQDIGLLSVDVDGNDYWIWEAINVINPRVIVCEYNSAFGPVKKLSIPYKADFYRTKAHYSNLYFGASLGAFCHLAEKKGYDFIGTAGGGVNAFFVRKDLSSPFKTYDCVTGFKPSANRDSKNKEGGLTYLRHGERLNVIKDLHVIDVASGQEDTIKNIFGL
jgi:hypothetical protein